jgi:hypothetical protein
VVISIPDAAPDHRGGPVPSALNRQPWRFAVLEEFPWKDRMRRD